MRKTRQNAEKHKRQWQTEYWQRFSFFLHVRDSLTWQILHRFRSQIHYNERVDLCFVIFSLSLPLWKKVIYFFSIWIRSSIHFNTKEYDYLHFFIIYAIELENLTIYFLFFNQILCNYVSFTILFQFFRTFYLILLYE